MNYAMVYGEYNAPTIGEYRTLFSSLDYFSKKLVLFLVILGNECKGVDLSSNGLDSRCMGALVAAVRSFQRPDFAKEVTTLILRDNELDAAAAEELAMNWLPGAEFEADADGGHAGCREAAACGEADAADLGQGPPNYPRPEPSGPPRGI